MVLSSTRLAFSGHAGFAEVFLGKDVGRDLAPMARNLEALERKHHRAVRIADLAHALPEGDGVIGRLASLGKFPFDPHLCSHPLENRLKAVWSRNR
jgi:hypothetical protein